MSSPEHIDDAIERIWEQVFVACVAAMSGLGADDALTYDHIVKRAGILADKAVEEYSRRRGRR